MPDPAVYAVAGRPVFHSRSPEIFGTGFRAKGISALYTRLAARNVEEIVLLADRLDLNGLNITSPFKEEIISCLDELDPTARDIGAVNIVVRKNGRLTGFNTDHFGVVRSFAAAGIPLTGRKVLVIGAGGAARAAVYGLLRRGCVVTIVNRTALRAEEIAKRTGCSWIPAGRMEETVRDSEIIVSCLSVPESAFDPGLLRRDHVILDARYRESQLAENAARCGGTVVSGRDWLLRQAAAGFEIMTGVPCPVRELKSALAEESPAHSEKAIALIGFMGSGKTTLGNILAAQLKKGFFDTDEMIESATGLTVPEIFARRGEAEFRALEKKVVRSLDFAPGSVVSLGGGAVLDAETRAIIKSRAHSVWIWANPETTADRVQRESRPLLSGEIESGRSEALFRSRIPAYAEAAHAVVINDGRPEGLKVAAQRIKDEIYPPLKY